MRPLAPQDAARYVQMGLWELAGKLTKQRHAVKDYYPTTLLY